MCVSFRIGLFYLFGGVGRLGEDGLPVRPYKHDEREVEEYQVDNWRKTLNRVSGIRITLTCMLTLNTSKAPQKS